MDQNFNTINLEYLETKKVSFFIKIIAFILCALFIIIPLYDLTDLFHTPSYWGYGCY